MRKIYASLFSLLFFFTGFSQVELIPAGDGGFENATTTMAANGWTVVDAADNVWVAGGFTSAAGANSAYISDNGGTNNDYRINRTRTSHFYRDIAVPAGGTNITLSFTWKSRGEISWDRFLVYTAPTSVTPAANIPSSPGLTLPGATLVYQQTVLTNAYATETINLPATLAGTTVRLIFTWQNDASLASQPAASIDDVSLTYIPAVNISAFTPASGCENTTPVIITGTNFTGATAVTFGGTGAASFVVNSNTQITAVPATGSTGPIEVTVPAGTATSATNFTVNLLPGAVTVSGGGTICGAGTTITATGGTGGTIYYQGTTSNGTSTAVSSSSQVVSASGTYYFRARSAGGCWGPEGSVTVTLNPLPAAVTTSGAGTFCNSTIITAAGGTGGTIYFQGTTSGGTSTATASSSQSVTTSGTYYFRARTALGCWGTEGSVTVTILPLPAAVTVTGGGTICGASATITAAGGTGGTIYYQGTTSNGTSAATASSSQVVSASGTYYFRARSAGGCWGPEGSVTVTLNPLPAAVTASGAGTFCNSTIITAAGGTGGTIYFQGTTSGGTSTATASSSQSVTTSGTYYFRARTALGCWGTEGSVTVTILPLPAAVTVTGGGTICGASATITAAGGTGGTIYYQGTTSNGTSAATASSSQVVSASGTYYFRARSAGGCWGPEGSVTVTLNPLPAAVTASGAGTFCGSTTITAAGGTGGTIYFQGTTSGGTSIATASASQVVATSGTYYFRARTASGCWGTEGSVTVTVNAVPFISAHPSASTQNVCLNAASTPLNITAGGTGITYQWYRNTIASNSGGVSLGAGATSASYTPVTTVAGTSYYYCIVSGTCLPAVTSNVSGAIIVNARPVANAVTGQPWACIGASTSLTSNATGIGSLTYTWASSAPAVATVTNAGIVTGVGAGSTNITYTVTDANGCQNTSSSFVLTVTPNAGAITGASSSCIANTLNLSSNATGFGALTYTWSSSNIAVATVTNTGVVTTLATGLTNITYTVTDGHSCSATSPAFPMLVTKPVANAITGATAVCAGSSITVNPNATGAAPFTYTWASSNAAAATVTSAGVVTGVAAGSANITYTVTDANGCSTTSAARTVTVNSRPVAGAITGLTKVCVAGTVNLAGVGLGLPLPLTYTWASSNTAVATVTNTGVVTGVAAGTTNITYTVTNGNGCATTSAAFTVTVTKPIAGNITGAATVCTGSAISLVSAGSGLAPLTYSWSSSSPLIATVSSAGVVTGISGGTTTITYTVTDANGCSTTSAGFVVTVSRPVANAITGATAVCAGSTITVNSNATGTAPLTYTWSSSNPAVATISGTGVVTGVGAGTSNITYTVTDANGCSTTSAARTITVNSRPVANAITGAPTVCIAGTVNLTSNASGAPLPLTYTWASSNPAVATVSATGVVTGVATGTTTITYTVTNGNGCSATSPAFTITITRPTANAITGAANVCAGATITLTSNATGTGILTYTWASSNNAVATVTNTGIVTGVSGGSANITYTVTDANGCSATSAVRAITVNPLPAITPAAAAAPVCFRTVAQNTTLTYSGAINSPNTYSIAWNASPSNSFINITNAALPASPITIAVPASTAAGTYTGTITVRNATGCISAGTSFTVTVNAVPLNTILPGTQTVCSGDNITGIILGNSNGVAGTTYTWSRTTPAGISGTVPVNGTGVPEGTTLNGVFNNANTSASTVTFTVNSTSPAGCAGAGVTATVVINPPVVITTQPVNRDVCAGTSVNFTVAATGVSLSYQWKKGTTNVVNGGNISGANSPTLTINPASVADNASDYNCVVTSAVCSNAISDYVSLTVTNSATTPTSQPTSLVFPTVGTTSVLGTFSASASATNYLVIRTATNTQPGNPVNGTSYVMGNNALGGYVEYTGTGNVFTSNGLSPNTTYYYWVYAYSVSTCGTSPLYYVTTPLTGNITTATTVACGTVTTLYWGGSGSVLTGATTSGTDFNTAANWSTSSPAYTASPVAPAQCNNASIALDDNVTITLSANASVYNLTYTIRGNNRDAILSVQGRTLTIYGNGVIDILSGNNNTSIAFGENSSGAGIVDFKANVRVGETNLGAVYPKSILVGNVNSKIIFRGDVLLGRTAAFILPSGVPGTGTTPGTVEFDGAGLQQILWNNNTWYDNFYNVVVGNQNSPYVRHVTGTYTPDNILNSLTINNGATVDLATSQWIRDAQGGSFTMSGTSKLILSNDRSIVSPGNGRGVVVPGSNFPGGFSTITLSPTSTIEYNGGSTMTQTVYGTPAIGSLTYGNLILSNGPTTGIANKISTSVINVAGNTNINDNTILTLGAGFVTNGVNGKAYVNNGGTLLCVTNVVSGTGSFTLQANGTLGIGLAAGITSAGATGNIQTATRVFGTGSNYIYNGTVAQGTGNGLPFLVNDLTILNTSGITMNPASRNYTIGGTLLLTSGSLNINGDTITVNKLQRNSGTFGGSATSSVGITGIGLPLFFTGGSQVLKNLFLTANASADLQTSLAISANSGSGNLSVGSAATLNTFDNLTLLSDNIGTARVSPIPEDGSGNALGFITGNVKVERYFPARRAWRLFTAPVAYGGSVFDNWQNGGIYAAGRGTYVSGVGATFPTGANGLDWSPLNNYSLKAGSTLTPVSNTRTTLLSKNAGTAADNQSYFIFVRGDRIIANTNPANSNTTTLTSRGRLQTGRQTFALTGAANAFTLVGNPYASPVDMKNIIRTNITNRYYVWDPYINLEQGGYVVFDDFDNDGTYIATPPTTLSQSLQSGQAFFTQTMSNAPASVVFRESAKSSTNNLLTFRPMGRPASIRVNLYHRNDNDTSVLVDGILAEFDNSYNNGVDFQDAVKGSNIKENIGLRRDSKNLTIERRPLPVTTDTLFIQISRISQRNYRLGIEPINLASGLTAYLDDNYTGVSTEISTASGSVVDFEVNGDAKSAAADRFKIIFTQAVIAPAPVTEISLKAHQQEKHILVEWTVENEMNIKGYEVEKSADGINFEKLSSSKASGLTTGNIDYKWLDENPFNGNNYYRIRSTNADGQTDHTGKVLVKMEKIISGIRIYPNPVTNNIIGAEFKNMEAGIYATRLINSQGQTIFTKTINHTEGTNMENIQPDYKMPAGIYQLEITSPAKQVTMVNVIVK